MNKAPEMETSSLILRSPHLQWLLAQLFPRLREWPVRQWPALMQRIRHAEFDALERLGIVIAVVITAWYLGPVTNVDASLPLRILLQMVSAVPLLLLMAGPFYLRRNRRALDQESRAQHSSGCDIAEDGL